MNSLPEQPPVSWAYGYTNRADLPQSVLDVLGDEPLWWETDVVAQIVQTEISHARKAQRHAPIELAAEMAEAEKPYRDALYVAHELNQKYESASWAHHSEDTRSKEHKTLKDRIAYLEQIVQVPSDDVYTQHFGLGDLPMYRRAAKTGERVKPEARPIRLHGGLLRLLTSSEIILELEPDVTNREQLLAKTRQERTTMQQIVDSELANSKTGKKVAEIKEGGAGLFMKLPYEEPKLPSADVIDCVIQFLESDTDDLKPLIPGRTIRKDHVTPAVMYTIAEAGRRLLTEHDGWEELINQRPLRDWSARRLIAAVDSLTAKFNGTVTSVDAMKPTVDTAWMEEYFSNVAAKDSIGVDDVERILVLVGLKSTGREEVYAVLESVVYRHVDPDDGIRVVATTRKSDQKVTAEQFQAILNDQSSRIDFSIEVAQKSKPTLAGSPGLGGRR